MLERIPVYRGKDKRPPLIIREHEDTDRDSVICTQKYSKCIDEKEVK